MRGFTLIELMVTIAIFALLVALGLFMSFEAYRGTSYRSERDTIVSLLQRARSRAMANIEQSEWSVCYDSGNYHIAKGDACPTGARETVEADAGVAAASNFGTSFPKIVFEQVTGNVSPEETFNVIEGSRNRTITINHEGTIIW